MFFIVVIICGQKEIAILFEDLMLFSFFLNVCRYRQKNALQKNYGTYLSHTTGIETLHINIHCVNILFPSVKK